MFTYIFDLRISEQIILAGLSAFIISLFVTSPVIKMLRKRKMHDGESVKDSEALQQIHKDANKADTPTMGGIAIFISIICSCLLWLEFSGEIIIGLIGGLLFFLLGAFDDLKKLKGRPLSQFSTSTNSEGNTDSSKDGQNAKKISINQGKDGLSFRKKLGLQVVISGLIAAGLLILCDYDTKIGFESLFSLEIGFGYFFVILVVLVGSSNAANLTDGLDGLAAGVTAIIACTLTVLGVSALTDYSAFSAIIAGVLGGFLWFNSFPAKIFMGDSGSMTIGFFVGYLAILMKVEILFIVIAGVLVAEALSVMIQVFYYKKTKKRIFLCAPLHHHFQFKGWAENQIVIRFWLVSVICAIAAIMLRIYI